MEFDDEDDYEGEVSLLEKPLFEECCEKHEREDAYGGPYGLVIGGMALPSFYDLSVQYLDAADYLVSCIKKQEVEDFTLSNPILFLYRHSIEMLIKSRLQDVPRNHSLTALLTRYREEMRNQYSRELPAWIPARVQDISDVDPSSTTFRYADIERSSVNGNDSLSGEVHVYLLDIQTVVRALHSALNDPPYFRTDVTRQQSGTRP